MTDKFWLVVSKKHRFDYQMGTICTTMDSLEAYLDAHFGPDYFVYECRCKPLRSTMNILLEEG